MKKRLQTIQVVVVDDDPSITRLVCAYLERGFKHLSIRSFNDACEARRVIDETGCDLLISDIEMPGCDGLEMLRFAKRRSAWTQVIFMTAHSTWDRINEAIEHGASDYLIKPVAKDELLYVVQHEAARISRWRTAVLETFRTVV